MPYSSESSVPKYVPKSRRRQWLHVFNSEWKKHQGDSASERERIAFSSANSIAGPHASKSYAKLLRKSLDDDVQAFADAVIAALEKEWESLPLEVQPALESAMLSGIGQGALQIEFSTAGMIASANTTAENYARERAAEMVGMKRDVEGTLVQNPDAKWAISNTSRDKIREIIADAFTEETPLEEIKSAIHEALEEEATGSGIFSEARAAMIARTEISRAQAGGNFSAWIQSGLVRKVKWLTSNLEPCDECLTNEAQGEMEINKPFASGSVMPPDHPNCACVLIVTEVSG